MRLQLMAMQRQQAQRLNFQLQRIIAAVRKLVRRGLTETAEQMTR